MRHPPPILIADDNPTNVDVMRARLAPHGYAIVTAKDGEEALAVALEQRPDLILLDLNMPKLDGLLDVRGDDRAGGSHERAAAVPRRDGTLVLAHEGTLEHFAGDGVVVLFNDPVEMPDHAERAVRMALAMRESARELNTGWGKHGWNMPLRIGVALGFATIGAVGRVVLQAAFLCGAAGPDRILVSQSVADAVESSVELEEIEPLTRHGFARTIRAFSVMGLKPPAEPGA